jgi:flagellin
MTNGSAISALQTLRQIGSEASRAQSQASSGLRVSVAADNAAYWSISTTMRSDDMAISAVSDALGLGAAKVDTAYAGLEAVVDILALFKMKLVTAHEDGVDKAKIQGELDQLKQQTLSIAQSASFNGENWLNTDIDDIFDAKLVKSSVVSSFVRDGQNNVSTKHADVYLLETSLFNSTGGGFLQADPRAVGTIGGLRFRYNSGDLTGMSTHSLTNNNGFHPLVSDFKFHGPMVINDGEYISFNITIDADNPADGILPPYDPGQTSAIMIDKALVNTVLSRTDGTINNYKDYYSVLNAALSGTGASATTYYRYDPPGSNNRVDVPDIVGIHHTGLASKDGSSMQITDLTVVGPTITGEISNTALAYGERRSSMTLAFEPFRVYEDVEISMDFYVDREAAVPLKFDKAYVNTILGVDDGLVATAADMALLLNSLVNRPDIIIEDQGYEISVRTDPTMMRKSGEKSSIGFSGIKVNIEPIPDLNFMEIDIEKNPGLVKTYTEYVERVSGRIISGAATLGALQTRIDLQSQFAQKLSDAIDSGIGRLVDADMNEVSMRLKALQTQEQLSIQSLQIANSAPENILSLFRQ